LGLKTGGADVHGVDAGLQHSVHSELVEQDGVRRKPNTIDLPQRTEIVHPIEKLGIDQRVAHDGREPDRPASDRDVVAYRLVEDLVRHELYFALLELVGTKHAVRIAEIGQLEMQLE